MRLIDDLCGMAAGWLPSVEADFAGAVQSSNASLIPAELVIDLALGQVASRSDRDTLLLQCERQTALLASDRRVVALTCDLGRLPAALAVCRLDSLDTVREHYTELLVGEAPVLSTIDLTAALPAATTLARMPCRELVLQIPSNLAPVPLAGWLAELRALLDAQSRPPGVVVMMRRATAAAAGELARCAALLAVSTVHADAIHLLPLLQPSSGARATKSAPWPAADYARLEALVLETGWTRSAPGFYRAPQSAVGCNLPTLLRMQHQVDVLGVGAAAISRFPPFCFRNHATLPAFTADLQRSGLGISDAFAQSPVWQLVSELMASLSGGATVDLDLVAAKYRPLPDTIRDVLDRTLRDLVDGGALSADPKGGLRLAAENDRAFGATVERLHALNLVPPSATVRMLRPRSADLR